MTSITSRVAQWAQIEGARRTFCQKERNQMIQTRFSVFSKLIILANVISFEKTLNHVGITVLMSKSGDLIITYMDTLSVYHCKIHILVGWR